MDRDQSQDSSRAEQPALTREPDLGDHECMSRPEHMRSITQPQPKVSSADMDPHKRLPAVPEHPTTTRSLLQYRTPYAPLPPQEVNDNTVKCLLHSFIAKVLPRDKPSPFKTEIFVENPTQPRDLVQKKIQVREWDASGNLHRWTEDTMGLGEMKKHQAHCVFNAQHRLTFTDERSLDGFCAVWTRKCPHDWRGPQRDESGRLVDTPAQPSLPKGAKDVGIASGRNFKDIGWKYFVQVSATIDGKGRGIEVLIPPKTVEINGESCNLEPEWVDVVNTLRKIASGWGDAWRKIALEPVVAVLGDKPHKVLADPLQEPPLAQVLPREESKFFPNKPNPTTAQYKQSVRGHHSAGEGAQASAILQQSSSLSPATQIDDTQFPTPVRRSTSASASSIEVALPALETPRSKRGRGRPPGRAAKKSSQTRGITESQQKYARSGSYKASNRAPENHKQGPVPSTPPTERSTGKRRHDVAPEPSKRQRCSTTTKKGLAEESAMEIEQVQREQFTQIQHMGPGNPWIGVHHPQYQFSNDGLPAVDPRFGSGESSNGPLHFRQQTFAPNHMMPQSHSDFFPIPNLQNHGYGTGRAEIAEYTWNKMRAEGAFMGVSRQSQQTPVNAPPQQLGSTLQSNDPYNDPALYRQYDSGPDPALIQKAQDLRQQFSSLGENFLPPQQQLHQQHVGLNPTMARGHYQEPHQNMAPSRNVGPSQTQVPNQQASQDWNLGHPQAMALGQNQPPKQSMLPARNIGQSQSMRSTQNLTPNQRAESDHFGGLGVSSEFAQLCEDLNFNFKTGSGASNMSDNSYKFNVMRAFFQKRLADNKDNPVACRPIESMLLLLEGRHPSASGSLPNTKSSPR